MTAVLRHYVIMAKLFKITEVVNKLCSKFIKLIQIY